MSGILASRTAVNMPGGGALIVGAGVSGMRVAEGLRREGYEGPVTILGAERHLPYDRPPLSKHVLTGELKPTVYHQQSYFDNLGVVVRTGVRVVSVDVDSRRVSIDDGSGFDSLPFDALVVASGARPRRLPCAVPAAGVHVVRTAEDALGVRAALLTASRVVVVGGGFIGAEVASSARSLGLEVTVVEAGAAPMERAIGPVMARFLGGLHELNGVTLRSGVGVTGFVGSDRVTGVLLDDGSALAADVVIVGVGVIPETDWLSGSSVPVGNGVMCDEYLRAGSNFVVGVGDAVSWPNCAMRGVRTRSQQWTTASDQGSYAAQMLVRGVEETRPFGSEMYFWSDQYGVKIQGVGELSGEVEVSEMRPDLSRVVSAYRQNRSIRGAVTVNAPKDFRRLREIVKNNDSWRECEFPSNSTI